MKKNLISKIAFLFTAVSISLSASAQEKKSEVQVKIVQDGKIIKDTTYMIEDEDATDAAIKMLDFTLGEKSAVHGHHVYSFKTEDGKSYEWTSADSGVHKTDNYKYVFAEEGEEGEITIHLNEDGERVIKKEVFVNKDDNDEEEVDEIIIINEDGPEDIELEGKNIEWIEKGDHKILIINDSGNEKKIKVITGDKENSSHNFITEDGKRIIIKEVEKGDNKEIEVQVTVDDEKGEMKKEEKKKKKK